MFFGRHTERVLREQSRAMQAALRTIKAYTPMPPTRGQRIAAWMEQHVLLPLARILTVGSLAYVAHMGWKLAG